MLRTPYKSTGGAGSRSANGSLTSSVATQRPRRSHGSQQSLDSEGTLEGSSRSSPPAPQNANNNIKSSPSDSPWQGPIGSSPDTAAVVGSASASEKETAVAAPLRSSPPTSTHRSKAEIESTSRSSIGGLRQGSGRSDNREVTSANDSFSSNGSLAASRRSHVGRIEVSYSSTLLFIWAGLLAIISYKNGFPLQSATILMLCSVALTSEHGESRLLWPLVFLSERCLDHAQHQGHSPIEFYSATLLSYLTLVARRAERRGKSARDRNVVLETVLYAIAGLSVVFFIVHDNTVSFAGVAFVGSGYIFFLNLLPHLGDNEAVLVSTIVGFYICDLCVNNNLSVDGGRENILSFNAPGYLTSYTHIASRGMALGAIYLMVSVSVLSHLCRVPVNKNSKSSERRISRKRITIAFVLCFAVVATGLFLAVSYQFRENVAMWLFAYIVSSKFRLWTLIAWLTCIPVAVLFVDLFTRSLRPTVRRKMFHFIAVVAFTPSAMIDPAFFAFAISTATSLCVTIELARHYGVYGTRVISHFVAHHIDERDSVKGAVRTHIYLIYGFGVSLMLQYRYHQQQLARPVPAIMELAINIIPGIISLGVVDASAAIIGSSFLFTYRRALGRYLKNKLFTERANASITHKTTTGTVGGLIAGLLFWALILALAEVPFIGPTLYTFTMIAVCSLTECFLDGIDNLQMPLVVLGAVNSLFSLLLPAPELWTNPAVCQPNPTTASSLASALTSPWKNWPPVPGKVKSLIG